MKLAILSDSHDNIWKLEAALGLMDNADAVIHCGDLCSPFMVAKMGEMLSDKPVHIVWGNNDGDIRLICNLAQRIDNFILHGQLAELELDGIRIAVNHYPEIAQPLARSGKYDLVCYGHNHISKTEKIEKCTLLNPGEIMGWKGPSTFAWFYTATHEVEFVEI